MLNQYKRLLVWQKAMDLVVEVYNKTNAFPKKEMFGITSQINRCVVSIASNIAEGAGRNSPREFNNFLGISFGSACELETQLMIAERLGYISNTDLTGLIIKIEEIQKMTRALQKKQVSEISKYKSSI